MMIVADVLACAFAQWYDTFKKDTIESIILPLPEDFLQYLHADGLVLPKHSTHGIYTKANNMAMDGDDDDEDIRDDDLMKMYEDDWSTPSAKESAKEADAPEFGDFDSSLEQAIKALGGKVFPKLNWSSPKDATWMSFDKTLLCTCTSDIYLLLKSSEFIAHDLDQPFQECDDYDGKNVPPVEYVLVLRKWQSIDPSTEFRCFVKNGALIGISQRHTTKFYDHILTEREAIVKKIWEFYSHLVSKFPSESYVFDVVCPKKGKVVLLDFNPFGAITDGLMFSWEELNAMNSESPTCAVPQASCLRCVECEEGVQRSSYESYALPRDIVDLAAGEDPFKFLDLMKMKIQKPDEEDNTRSDDDETQDKRKTCEKEELREGNSKTETSKSLEEETT